MPPPSPSLEPLTERPWRTPARLVVVAVVAAAGDGAAVVIEDLGHRDGDPVADQFPGRPAADGLDPPELPVHVVDQSVVGKCAPMASSPNALTAAMCTASTAAGVEVSVMSFLSEG